VRLNLETFEVDSVLDLTRIAINSETTVRIRAKAEPRAARVPA
jgi:hypothetical protein